MNFKFFQEGLKTNVIKISIKIFLKILVDKIEFLIYYILKMWVLRAQDTYGMWYRWHLSKVTLSSLYFS